MMHAARHGRWDGRLTNRPLPDRDPELERLSDGERTELAAVWLSRAASERRVGEAFAVIADDLVELGASAEVVALARRAIDDERRHAELARVLATRCLEREVEPPPRLELVVPEHRGAAPRQACALRVLGHCALNETFASAYLEAGLALARAPLARAALQALLSDEIDHARIGWAALASLAPDERSALTPWLPALLVLNLSMWRAAKRPGPERGLLARHGVPPADVVERALLGAVRELVLPGLARLGFETDALRTRLERDGFHATAWVGCEPVTR
jgi:hypothetical protein